MPGVTSTPLAKAEKSPAPTEETPSKKTDIIEEFWLKSAEIRKSLGLTPLDRSSKILDKSLVLVKDEEKTTPEEPKPAFAGRAVIRRLNITLEGQVITPLSPAASDRRELSSSSGLGLNGSLATSHTATSDSYATSDSTMLTPPSSPPPPVPANQSPAVLRQQRHQASWSSRADKSPSKAKSPVQVQVPVPAPRTQPSPALEPKPAPAVVMREKKKKAPPPEESRKSFVETVEEIPFADDVEETYDDRTPDTSRASRERPPLHLALAMENGKPNIPVNPVTKLQRETRFSPEAREIAEERIRARENSVKSQALKDAMAKQLNKMKEADGDRSGSAKVPWNRASSAVKALESKKAEILPERFFSSNKSLDSSAASSDGSTVSKSKKRSSLFSPRKNKKEKKAKSEKNDGRHSGAEETPPKHKSLWKAVFSGYKKDKKKKEEKSCPSTPSSSSATHDSAKKRASPLGKSAGECPSTCTSTRRLRCFHHQTGPLSSCVSQT